MTEWTLAIVTPTLNEAHNLQGLKASIDALRDEVDVELITVIIDTGSDDGSPDVATSLGFDIVVVSPDSNIPIARNIGVRSCESTHLAFIDADCRPHPGWLRGAFSALDDEEFVVGGWPTRCPSPPTWVQRAWQAHLDVRIGSYDIDERGKVHRDDVHRLITTANMVLTRAAFDRLDGFDEALATGSDTEFVYRAHEDDLLIIGIPAMYTVHEGEPATFCEFFRRQLWNANPRAYRGDGKQRHGRNPQLFTRAFGAGIAVGLLGTGIETRRGRAWRAATAWVPLIGVVVGPATRTAWRSRRLHLTPGLAALYGAYGMARALRSAGCRSNYRSWRNRTR